MAKIHVTLTPASGDEQQDSVEVEADGTSVRKILEQAGRSPEKMNIFVGGNAATLDTHVEDGAEIRLEERASGS